MKIPGVRVLVPVLVGTMFAACAPTREVSRTLTAADFTGVNHYAIDNELYFKIGVRGDTLVCKRRTWVSPLGDGSRIPLTIDDAVQNGLDRSEVIILEFLPDATLLASGDTVYVPVQALDISRLHVTNPAFVAGAVIGTVLGVGSILLIIAFLSLVAALGGIFAKIAG